MAEVSWHFLSLSIPHVGGSGELLEETRPGSGCSPAGTPPPGAGDVCARSQGQVSSSYPDHLIPRLVSRLPTVNTIKIPEDIDAVKVCGHMMKKSVSSLLPIPPSLSPSPQPSSLLPSSLP